MKQLLLLILFGFGCTTLFSQYKNDNVLFKTVYLQDLCRDLKNNPDHILLDVRSKGEYEDTSIYQYLNIGHLNGARNIDIRELPARWRELEEFKQKKIYVYCSHSQRSRRASKLLADSGFVNVVNINGGLTGLHMNELAGCNELYKSNSGNTFFSPARLCRESNNKNLFILDIRNDSVFNGISGTERLNLQGKLKNAVNIPFTQLPNALSRVPKNKQVLIVDEYGNDASKAAKLLKDKGYKSVAILFNGMEGFISVAPELNPCRNQLYTPLAKYELISPDEFNRLQTTGKNVMLIDIRKAEEFNNESKDNWRNVGKLKNARNIPYTEMENSITTLSGDKNAHIVLYTFSGQPELFTLAKKLADNGFTNVKVLNGGIFNLRWTAANLKNKSHLNDWVVDMPAENR